MRTPDLAQEQEVSSLSEAETQPATKEIFHNRIEGSGNKRRSEHTGGEEKSAHPKDPSPAKPRVLEQKEGTLSFWRHQQAGLEDH